MKVIKVMRVLVKQAKLPLISIIVPVYNTADYLDQCLKSIRNQTMKNIEIIMIDDGSTDGSGVICNKYVAVDARFIVVHKTVNEGLSAARNDGLKMARAQYVMWVDSDDWIDSEFCEATYRVAEENNADIVAFQFLHYDESDKPLSKKPFPKEGIIPKEEALTKYWSFASMVVWNKLYRHELFDGIQYPVGYLCEDVAVTYRVIYKAESIYLLDRVLYHHRLYRPGSIINNKSTKRKADLAFFSFMRLNDIKRWGYVYSKDEEEILALSYLARIGRCAKYSSQCETILHVCKCFTKNTSWMQRVMFSIYKLSPFLFDVISILMGRRVRGYKEPY